MNRNNMLETFVPEYIFMVIDAWLNQRSYDQYVADCKERSDMLHIVSIHSFTLIKAGLDDDMHSPLANLATRIEVVELPIHHITIQLEPVDMSQFKGIPI